MSAIEKTKQAISVAEKYNFQSIISIEGNNFPHLPAGIHLADLSEIQHMDYEIEGDSRHSEMYVMLDGVRVYVILQVHQHHKFTKGDE